MTYEHKRFIRPYTNSNNFAFKLKITTHKTTYAQNISKMNEETQLKFPYEVLESFGLTQSMIDDLPENILETIYSGGRSPLLPIVIKTDEGELHTHAKFRLIPPTFNEEEYGLIFYPKLKEVQLDMFTDEEKKLLNDGRALLTTIDFSSLEDESIRSEECYVQIDPDTNHVFYVHTPVIGRNLRGVDGFLELSPDVLDKISKGEVVTIEEPEIITIGIDLFTPTGVFVCQGDEQNWSKVKDKSMPQYSFGIEGCWVNDSKGLHYVKEEDYDADIETALQNNADYIRAQKAYNSQEPYSSSQSLANHSAGAEDKTRIRV